MRDEQRLFEQMMAGRPRQSWREATVEAFLRSGFKPGDTIELRISNMQDGDAFARAQRVADALFSMYHLYPSSLAMHSTVAHLFEASEFVVVAKHRAGANAVRLLGEGFRASPLHIEVDDSLNTHTIAARFRLDLNEDEDAAISVIERIIQEGRQ